jgi:predicted nucleic acid-binding protein
LYILDTDILNKVLHPSSDRERVLAKIHAIGDEKVWFSIVTVHEKLFNGLLPALNTSLGKKNEVRCWQDAHAYMSKFSASQILEFTQADYDRFKMVYTAVGKAPLDCRIAASALTRGWTVASFNSTDFNLIKSRVPNLLFDDWSIRPNAA